MDSQENTFHIGLCMAGAISAGAYTAGVMDYLIEALDEWDSKRGQPGVPTHRVMISVLGGASAGGMTGIVSSAALNKSIERVKLTKENLLSEQTQNPFYHSWVDLIQEDMFPLMLDTTDIKNKKLFSLLNSQFIDRVAERAIAITTSEWVERAFIGKNLKVFSTITNLEGFCRLYRFRSARGFDNHVVRTHNDYGCFVLNPDSDDDSKGWIPLDFRTGKNLDTAREVAMATGAFPVGLRSRRITRPKTYIDELDWLADDRDDSTIIKEPYETINVDGGMINNEPFEHVRKVLVDITKQENEGEINNYSTFESTVLMIDPFPSTKPDFKTDDDLLTVMGSTFSAMMNQLRIKPAIVRDALASDYAGQFLIAPARYLNDVKLEGADAIACGTLGGFGGFLSKEFRIHDYLLGRDNCEKFLLEYFCVPPDSGNTIFDSGYNGIDRKPFQANTAGDLQIIPIFKTRQNRISQFNFFSSGTDWPAIRESKIDEFSKPLRNRINAVLMNLDDFKPVTQAAVWVGAKLFLNKKLAKFAMEKIKDSLRGYKLLR